MTAELPAQNPFHPTVTAWFADHFTAPTEVQINSWPSIASGNHVLITAPTGSGKTLTAFMWSLSQFAAEPNPPGRTRVLYISPLKALNTDIKQNLLTPLQTLNSQYNFPKVSVETRSGDTTTRDRQRMLRQPPDILITTPESLGLLLTTSKGRQALAWVETVILDEVHAIVDNRRGAQLLTNLEHLVDIAGDFQRIALSATVFPLETVASFVAGYDAHGAPRPIQIINTPGHKQLEFRVRFPAAARDAAENGQKIWEPLSESFKTVIAGNAATLFFTNSRRLAEKITLKINQDQDTPLAYAHHGSLARDVRTEVETRLKAGELKAIVATNSLEMGIDVGHLDEVVMVQSPPSVASTLQRMGRAGHSVGETSIGTLFPTHAHDFLEAAVLARAVAARDIEPQHTLHAPLDVLAQIIIALCANEARLVDQLFDLITRAAPYRSLSRERFNLVLDMLTGRYGSARVRELKPRLVYDRIEQTVKATRGAVLAYYSSGGTIPDRGYFQLKHADSGAALGELDEEFVWEATIGQTFTFGTQHWQIQRITHNDVLVRPANPNSAAPPFWRSEFFNRSYHFSARITEYLEEAESQLAAAKGSELSAQLQDSCGFDETAAKELVDYLNRQREHTQCALPHRHHLLLELVKSGPAGYKGPGSPQQLVIHTHWGGRLNQPWSLALRAAWQQRHGQSLEIHADNNAIVAQIEGEVDPHELLTLVNRETLMALLRQNLEQSGFFGARFRECAGRALLLSKPRFNQRLPLWMSRMQAKKLMTQVKKLHDFPVLLETWRTCLEDEFDLPALIERLTEIEQGVLSWSFVQTQTPSPFAHNLTFGQVSRYMYADDTPDDNELSNLSTDLITQALYNPALRPAITTPVIEDFEAKRQRRADGYEPTGEEDWSEWLKERVLIPVDELPDDARLPKDACWIEFDQRRWVTHLELMHVLHASGFVPTDTPLGTPVVDDNRDALNLAREVLSFYGPLTADRIIALLPSVPDTLWAPDEAWITGRLVEDSQETFWCDADNFEILMRFQRASRRSSFEPVATTRLPLFWASLHRLNGGNDDTAILYALENLRGYPCAVSTWINDLLPARIPQFNANQWDDVLSRFGFAWQGCGIESITVAYPEELVLFSPSQPLPRFAPAFVDAKARYTFGQIAEHQGNRLAELNAHWWPAVWQGQISTDAISPLQQALARKFEITDRTNVVSSRRRLRRAPQGWSGNWQLLPAASALDPLSALEEDKDRVRLLLDRYGFVCRDVVNRENMSGHHQDRPWRWREAFRALRIMELGGEVLTGHFFEGLSTPQFISHRALNVLQTNLPGPEVFWIAATDPVSPCGLGLDWPQLPQRRLGNYLVFADGQLALVIENFGKTLTYHLDWNHPQIDAIHGVLDHLVDVRRMHIPIHTINAIPARQSPYLAGLERQFSLARDHKQVTLQPGF